MSAESTVTIAQRFVDLVAEVAAAVSGHPLDCALEQRLNRDYPPTGAWFREMSALCRTGCEQGWLCSREAGGIRYGRPIKPGPQTEQFSVDVVDMNNIAGPHHAHPGGEIDLVMPLEGDPAFDGTRQSWKVYEPGSAHRPTVTGGRALVLYLLPEGQIEFTRA